ncbi:MAG: hypothetical protein ACYC56_04015 [Candidatus Aquicultor sp.]
MTNKIIEHGDLYFFYRPKVHEEEVRDLGDVERFYLVMAPQEPKLFRLLIVGQKYMPEILPGRMAPQERNWLIVDYVTDNGRDLEHLAGGYPGAEERLRYPQDLMQLFDESWINVKDEHLLDYENTQILLIGARKQDIEGKLGIHFTKEDLSQAVDKLYSTLHMTKEDHPLKSLIEGQWPESKEAA